MGGTFDPIHNGHLVAASEVAAALNLDQVVFVPTGAPAQKQQVTDGEHRYLMTVIATAANPRFMVSRVDIDRDKSTYTVDTLRDLKTQYPDAELFFITGSDAIAQILAWQQLPSIFAIAPFLFCPYHGFLRKVWSVH
jgi:nicotinate-nucleotide adenylyltransferase